MAERDFIMSFTTASLQRRDRTACILVSACLLGEPCKYNGGSNRNEGILEQINRLAQGERARFIPVCPEVMGGLPAPRVPAEIQGERVMTADGRDVTEEYRRGAELALRLAEDHGCRLAVLKERSPSCGSGRIYDGTFSGQLVNGDGITARLLRENGVKVIGETEALEALREL